MDDSEESQRSTNRRSVLQLTALAGGLGLVPSGATAGEGGSRGRNASAGTTVLGDFEEGLDGWTTTGPNDLERVTETAVPTGVAAGEHALAVEIDGDSHPVVVNRRRVREADFVRTPHLRLHVLAQADGTDSDLLFRFRLHHAGDADRGDGGGRNRGRGKEENVVESAWKRVAQLRPQKLQWDTSDVPDSIRERAKRLEIAWYLEDHAPADGHHGRNHGGDYEGFVVLDDVRLFEADPTSETRRRNRKKRALHRDHGMITDREFEERREGYERGTLTFVDGTTVPYTFEVLEDGRFEYTVDGERFEIGGAGE